MNDLTQKELAYIVAAVGRVTNPLNVDLFEKLYNQLDSYGLTVYHALVEEMRQ